MKEFKVFLREDEIPKQWYNIQADMLTPLQPPLHPATRPPVGPQDLAPVFPTNLIEQEVNTKDRWIDIPQEVMEKLLIWRPTPLHRAYALEKALDDTTTMTGNDLFFAWFNVGTSHVALKQYADAAPAYDQAFMLYAGLSNDDTKRPYRITWYQTGPFWAYFYSGRYEGTSEVQRLEIARELLSLRGMVR